MQRFHFNVYDGVATPDPIGTALAGLCQAPTEAVRSAGVLIKDDPKGIALGHDWRIEVTDDGGLVLFRISVSLADSPAVMDDIRSGALA